MGNKEKRERESQVAGESELKRQNERIVDKTNT